MMQIEVKIVGGPLASERNRLWRRGSSLLLDSRVDWCLWYRQPLATIDFNYLFQNIYRFDGT
jgi:hypothetical protein